jgi:hypothetical protein
MPLSVPQIDDRAQREILDEALARIPVHNPEWTNFNDADPGVTLLQLFAFMTESLLYRANLVPERNRRKFLQLLGIPLRPAGAAAGVITISNERGPPTTVTLPRHLPVAAGAVGFITGNALDVLPVEARVFYRARLAAGAERQRAERLYTQLYAGDEDDPAELDFYRTAALEPPAPGARIGAVGLSDTVDGAFWLALLVREADGAGETVRNEVAAGIAGRTLTLGLSPAWDAAQRELRPGRSRSPSPALSFDISTGEFADDQPRYRPLAAHADGDPLEETTLVQLTLPGDGAFKAWHELDPMEDGVGELPPALEDEELAERVLCWIRIRVAQQDDDAPAVSEGWAARFSWIGINAARVAQQVATPPQRVGTGTGEPDQTVSLANTPVIPETVVLTVDGEPWRRTEDLLAAAPEIVTGAAAAAGGADARVYEVDRESGTIRFGTGHAGKRPRAGAVIVASYAYGGGRAGNVGVGGIRTAPQLPAGFKVTNPLPTTGGDDGESVEDAERRIPLHLKHRDRAVSAEDFRDIVRETPGVALGRVEVLAAWHPSIGAPAPGVVTLLLVPRDPQRPEAPVPDRRFLQAVCRHLEPRRLLTTEVVLRGPEYVALSVAIGFDVVAGVEIATVREGVTSALRTFLSPLDGGQDERGWPLDRPVEDRELWARAARVPGVAAIRGVRMFDAGGAEIATLPLSGLQLPRLDHISVRAGDAEDLAAERPAVAPDAAARRVPVPVVPASC